MRWTADDMPSQEGRTAIVTGANSGIGYQTSLALARHGAAVVLACRNRQRGEQARARMLDAGVSAERVTLAQLDLADLSSVRSFATAHAGTTVDLLVNNAGLMAIPHRRTADGFEMQLGVNHLGHFALTGLLLPALRRAAAARVVTVSSNAHRMGTIDFDDLHHERRYRRWGAYGQSKLANLLFAFELDRRAQAAGRPLLSVAAHPGFAATHLSAQAAEEAGRPLVGRLVQLGTRLVAQSDAAGALPPLYAATAPGVHGGEYYGPDGVGQHRGGPTLVSAKPAAYDRAAAQRLWAVSEEATGVRYLSDEG